MNKGKIVFLCGPTSTGKTSIVDAMQDISEEFFYAIANDLVAQMVGEKYYRIDFLKYQGKAVYYMYHMAKLLSDMGENVLIDGTMQEEQIQNHYETVMEIFKESPLTLVEVFCPLEICRERNLARGDRWEMQSAEQMKNWNPNVKYDIRVETHLHSPTECAAEILQYVFPAI